MNKETEDALHMLLHCSLKDTEYETQFKQYKIVRKYITNLQKENKRLKEEIKNILKELEDYIQGDIDGFMTINEFGGCNDILEVLQNYIDKIQELKEKYK